MNEGKGGEGRGRREIRVETAQEGARSDGGMDRFRFSCSVGGAALSLLSVRRGKNERLAARRRYERGDDQMTRKRWMTVERGTYTGRMVYQTGRLLSLFRIRMRVSINIQLHQDRRGAASRYPSYSPFRSRSRRETTRKGWRETGREKIGARGETECVYRRAGAVY